MSMTDPIADLLTRIRNGQSAGKPEVSLASSKLKKAVLKVLKDEGYIADFRPVAGEGHETLTVDLKYFEGKPVIDRIERVSSVSFLRPASPSFRNSMSVGTTIDIIWMMMEAEM